MQLIEWILDVGLYGVNVEFAREAYVAMRSLLVGHLFLQGAMGRSCRVAAHCFYGADDLVGGDDEQWMEGAGGGGQHQALRGGLTCGSLSSLIPPPPSLPFRAGQRRPLGATSLMAPPPHLP